MTDFSGWGVWITVGAAVLGGLALVSAGIAVRHRRYLIVGSELGFAASMAGLYLGAVEGHEWAFYPMPLFFAAQFGLRWLDGRRQRRGQPAT